MNKLLVFIPLLFLFFFIPVGLSNNINFDFNYTILTKDITDRIYAYNYPSNESWFISTIYDSKLQINKLDETFSTVLINGNTFCSPFNYGCLRSDCILKENITLGLGLECISDEESGGNSQGSINFFKLNDLSKTQLSYGGYAGSNIYKLLYGSISDLELKLWKQQVASSDLRYTDASNILGNQFIGSGSFDLPTTYENIEDLQIRSCGGMYHVILLKNSKIYDLIYDYSKTYKTVYLFSPIDWITTENNYGVWCDNNTNSLYVTIVNNTFNEGKISFQKWNTGVYTLINVWAEIYNQTIIEPNVNGTSGYYIAKPFLTKDRFNRFYLFYEYNIPSTNQLRVSADTSCVCGSWTNTTECSDNYVKQVRNCPFDCNEEEQYVYSIYCAKQVNASQGIYEQKTKQFTDCVDVDSGLIATSNNPTLRRDVSIDIPLNCSNVIVNSSFNLYTIVSDSVFRTQKNQFTTSICNPLTDCDNDNSYVCQDGYYSNLTYSKNSDSYIGGDTAKAGFIVNGYPCKVSSNWFGYEGWIKYGIIGDICYSCDILCGGYKCETQGLIDYSIYEMPDCSTNNTFKTECINGCDYPTGRCKGGTPIEQTQDILNPTNWINALLHPNATTKVVLGLTLSFVMGIFGLYIVGNSENNGVIFAIGFGIGFIIFSFTGWIPIVFSIIIVFMVGAYGLLKFIK